MATPFPEESGTVQKKRARPLRAWIVLALAILAGLVAAYLAVQTLKTKERDAIERILARSNQGTIDVVVPTQNLAPGALLSYAVVSKRAVPADTAPADVITPEQFDTYVGHRINIPLTEGKPILRSYLSGKRALADIIAPDKLALTMTVDNVSTLNGLLQPGDKVDILWFYKPPQNDASDDLASKDAVRYLDSGIKVMATGTRTISDDSQSGVSDDPAAGSRPESFSTVTLELSPDQVEKMTLAKRLGELQLVLRPANAQGKEINKVFTIKDILGTHERARRHFTSVSDTIEYIVGGTGGHVARMPNT
ncbi:Flp pilus assembly protein CpaB [Acidithiobacillus sp. IBUN Pt1247-S3]|uniref:Flp pilus assembly protein CpaB n=1 Tax=Acidithiobacillus sp. IBUN Pt1247-S3 TaxID=3166642 RepID=UPI0034E535C4